MKIKLLFFFFIFGMSSSVFAQDILMQDGEFQQCSGNFYDEGGPDATYSSFSGEETQVLTLCPEGDMRVRVDFTEFLIAGASDYLYIYDGDSTDAPLIDDYTGANNPGTVIASGGNPTGCLTFEFVPDGNFSPLAGWEAEISCEEPCQEIDPELISVSPSDLIAPGTYEVAVLEEITFEGTAVFENSGENATYEWDFDDGTSAFGETVSHEFDATGTYEINLIVTDDFGCSHTLIFEVVVEFFVLEVDTTTYTVPELVEDVLIDNPCANISNITWSTGTNFGDVNGIGYFNQNNSSFPIEDGVVLYSGDALNDVPGATGSTPATQGETGSQSSGGTGWPGDADLTDLIQEIEGNTTSDSENASIIEFDFVSFADQMSFNFLFASDEYGGFQCSFSDVFAFFLTDSNGNTTNLAVVPGTNTPVAVTTVRDDTYNGGCASQNVGYFDTFYGAGGANPSSAPINLRGNTVIMTAQSTVIPGEQYHIKLAIADRNDTALNSAVFLEAGSFDIGSVDLGSDITAVNGTATCEGQTVTLDVGLSVIDGVTIEWYQDGELLPGEDQATLEVTEPGNYEAVFQYLDDCVSSDVILVEFLPTPDALANNPEDLFLCSNETEETLFDLTANDDNVLGDQDAEDFEITYYTSEEDADDATSPILNPTEYVFTGSADVCEEIFVRIEGVAEGELTNCYDTASFELCIGGINVGDMQDLTECDPENDDVTEFDLTENDAAALDGLASDEYTVSYYESQALADAGDTPIGTPTAYENTLANPQEIFVRVENNESPNCYAADNSFFIEAIPSGIANTPDLINYCYVDGLEEVDLTQNTVVVLGAQDSNDFTVSYYENSADAEAGTNVISAPDVYQPGLAEGCMTIYVRIENNADTSCYNTTSFEVCTIITEVVSVDNLEECDSDSNGSAVFDLTQNDSVALGADQGSSDYSVSYYEDEASAEAGTPAIGTPTAYENSASPQTIWVRVESNTLTSCYAVASFTITSYENGIANPVPDLSYCDTDTNGDAVYDLTQNTPILLGAQDANDFTVSYYETIAE
ncbi:choice-of-anchor L domain-containing protein, partial [Mesonia aquimarina]|uniref:choice-of-anchor L domain-containing protein n=1 Tax=Mesonia aquimarina TaxID=1504967 RepID=UPI0013CE971F